MRIIGQVSRILEKFFTHLAIAIFTVMVIVTFLQVIFRKAALGSLVWSEELAKYSLVWMTFIGAALGLKHGVHVAVEAVMILFPPRIKRIVGMLHYCLIAIFSAVLVFWGTKLALFNLKQPSPAMRIPIGFAYFAIPASATLMIVFAAARFTELLVPGMTEEGGKS